MSFSARLSASARGTSLIEMLIATSLLSLLMAAAYGSLISQMRTHATQTLVSETQLAARSALAVLTDQIAAAGLGVPHATAPAPATALVTIEPQKLSFWANFPPQHTFLAGAAEKKSTQLTVQSTAGIRPGTTAYIANSDAWHLATVVKVGDGTIMIDSPLGYAFAAGSPLMPVEQITFELTKGTLLRNSRPLIAHVRDLTFTYDAGKADAVRVIGVQLTVETRSVDADTGAPLAITVSSEIAPANLAL